MLELVNIGGLNLKNWQPLVALEEGIIEATHLVYDATH